MEIILAVVVVAAVIFFGALISMGNERQRRAIDNFREQTVLWALQDLRIKREKLARDIRVDDPIGWLNKIAANVSGINLDLQVVEVFENPRTLVCIAGDASNRFAFSPISISEFRKLTREKRSRLSQFSDQNPLIALSRQPVAYEISVLNAGILFDLELPIVWKALTGQEVDQMELLWMYIIK